MYFKYVICVKKRGKRNGGGEMEEMKEVVKNGGNQVS